MLLGYLIREINNIEDLKEEDKSSYGEFTLTVLEDQHPDLSYEEIKEQEQFLYTHLWDDGNEVKRVIFFKPFSVVEALLADEELKSIYIKNEDNIKIYNKEDLTVIQNVSYNLALVILRGN